MGWKAYCAIFRLKSPLHIGYRKVGNLMQTRPYVTGRVLWGALTARLVRDFSSDISDNKYEKVGKAVNENFRFGYLWPAVPIDSENNISLNKLEIRFPWDDKDPPFDYLLLDAYASTSLDYDRYGATEGSLHQVEFIMPYTRSFSQTDPKPVFLVGDIFVKENLANEEKILGKWKCALKNIQLGAERAYGWGKVDLVKIIDGKTLLESCNFEISLKEEVIIVSNGSENRALAHIIATDELDGYVEVLTGYEMKSDGKYKLVKSPPLTYPPGTYVDRGKRLIVDHYGLWKLEI